MALYFRLAGVAISILNPQPLFRQLIGNACIPLRYVSIRYFSLMWGAIKSSSVSPERVTPLPHSPDQGYQKEGVSSNKVCYVDLRGLLANEYGRLFVDTR